MSIFRVILVGIFPYLDLIWGKTAYSSVYSPNAGKCGPLRTLNKDTFHAVELKNQSRPQIKMELKSIDFLL